MKLKEEIKSFVNLERRFNKFSDIEHIALLNDVYLPKVLKFSQMIEAFEASNQEMRESIRKFDETILRKVNKGTFELYKEEAK